MQNSTPENIKTVNPYYSRVSKEKLNVSNSEWEKVLPKEVYSVMRLKGTERAFTGKYWDLDQKGDYYCAACGNHLFRSDAKFASTCGWPSFFEQINPKSITFQKDISYGMNRIEALCSRCDGHLGHLFDDGPEPTRKRYCMNSAALDFVPDQNSKESIKTNADEIITLAGGCFWCIEAIFAKIKGVKKAVSGYSGGTIPNPTYREVCTGTTNHAEVVELVYDPDQISLEEILKVFFTIHDPTTLNRQGADVGTQYRSAIFYRNEKQKEISMKMIEEISRSKVYDGLIVTKLEPYKTFFEAEDYHQEYYKNNKNAPYCRMVIQPKIEKFEKLYLK